MQMHKTQKPHPTFTSYKCTKPNPKFIYQVKHTINNYQGSEETSQEFDWQPNQYND